MVKAIIDISEPANRIINIVKAKYGLRNKSRAIEVMAREYEKLIMEPELRPEYIDKLGRIEKERAVKVGSVKGLEKMLGD